MSVCVLISGGQTGVDQGALRAAASAGVLTAGWCPPGRACEGGVIPPEFPLMETPEERSERAPDVERSLRTEWNVRDSDATLILLPAGVPPDAGTFWTIEAAGLHGRPLLELSPAAADAVVIVREWLADHGVRVLNVAGPSEGTAPGIGAEAERLIRGVLQVETES